MENPTKNTRIHRSEEEIKALLAEFETSNVTVKEFCEIYSINEATFYYWRNKYTIKSEAPGEFIEIVDDSTFQSMQIFAEIELPGKGTVRFFEKVGPEFFKALF